MESAGRLWRNVLSLSKNDGPCLGFLECSPAYKFDKFCEEVEELLMKPDGIRLKIIDGEVTIQWSGLNPTEWCRMRTKTYWLDGRLNPWCSITGRRNGRLFDECPDTGGLLRSIHDGDSIYEKLVEEKNRMGILMYETMNLRRAWHAN